jgi:hypothetical protein
MERKTLTIEPIAARAPVTAQRRGRGFPVRADGVETADAVMMRSPCL